MSKQSKPEPRRDPVFRFRVYPQEHYKIMAGASCAGYRDASKWARDILLEAAEKSIKSPVNDKKV